MIRRMVKVGMTNDVESTGGREREGDGRARGVCSYPRDHGICPAIHRSIIPCS